MVVFEGTILRRGEPGGKKHRFGVNESIVFEKNRSDALRNIREHLRRSLGAQAFA